MTNPVPKYRALAAALTGALLFSATPIAAAAPNENASSSHSGSSSAQQTYGVKGFIAKQSLKGVAWLLRNTPEVIINRAGRTLDKEAQDKILQHSGAIADKVDQVAETTELVHHQVKDKLRKELTPLMDYDNALMIADVIAWLAL